MTDRLLIAGELGSRHGTAAVLLADPGNRRWLGQADGDGEVLLLSSGVVRTIDDDPQGLQGTLAALGINPGALLGVDNLPALTLRGYPCLDLSGDLATARMRKDSDEVELITAAADLASRGQQAVRSAARTGASETELWSVAQSSMAAVSGEKVEALVDLLVGPRTALMDGGPGASTLAPGDPVLFDLAPNPNGYWADSCSTFAVGEPSAALRKRHDIVRGALELGIAAVRPGVSAGAVDSAIRADLEANGLHCPHHTGHGVGAASQEPPWLIPGEKTVLEEGMALALEPGAYGAGFGVRLEHLVLVEPDGARPLTNHSLNLS